MDFVHKQLPIENIKSFPYLRHLSKLFMPACFLRRTGQEITESNDVTDRRPDHGVYFLMEHYIGVIAFAGTSNLIDGTWLG